MRTIVTMAGKPGWLPRIGWVVLIWAASVAGLGFAAMALRMLMRLAGMTS
mgnify:CR=1 FL=1